MHPNEEISRKTIYCVDSSSSTSLAVVSSKLQKQIITNTALSDKNLSKCESHYAILRKLSLLLREGNENELSKENSLKKNQNTLDKFNHEEGWLSTIIQKASQTIFLLSADKLDPEIFSTNDRCTNKIDGSSISCGKTPLSIAGLDRHTLYCLGMTNDLIEKIYRSLFVYSTGFHSFIKEISSKCKEKGRFWLETNLWRLFLHALESCDSLHYKVSIKQLSNDNLCENKAIDNYQNQLNLLHEKNKQYSIKVKTLNDLLNLKTEECEKSISLLEEYELKIKAFEHRSNLMAEEMNAMDRQDKILLNQLKMKSHELNKTQIAINTLETEKEIYKKRANDLQEQEKILFVKMTLIEETRICLERQVESLTLKLKEAQLDKHKFGEKVRNLHEQINISVDKEKNGIRQVVKLEEILKINQETIQQINKTQKDSTAIIGEQNCLLTATKELLHKEQETVVLQNMALAKKKRKICSLKQKIKEIDQQLYEALNTKYLLASRNDDTKMIEELRTRKTELEAEVELNHLIQLKMGNSLNIERSACETLHSELVRIKNELTLSQQAGSIKDREIVNLLSRLKEIESFSEKLHKNLIAAQEQKSLIEKNIEYHVLEAEQNLKLTLLQLQTSLDDQKNLESSLVESKRFYSNLSIEKENLQRQIDIANIHIESFKDIFQRQEKQLKLWEIAFSCSDLFLYRIKTILQKKYFDHERQDLKVEDQRRDEHKQQYIEQIRQLDEAHPDKEVNESEKLKRKEYTWINSFNESLLDISKSLNISLDKAGMGFSVDFDSLFNIILQNNENLNKPGNHLRQPVLGLPTKEEFEYLFCDLMLLLYQLYFQNEINYTQWHTNRYELLKERNELIKFSNSCILPLQKQKTDLNQIILDLKKFRCLSDHRKKLIDELQILFHCQRSKSESLEECLKLSQEENQTRVLMSKQIQENAEKSILPALKYSNQERISFNAKINRLEMQREHLLSYLVEEENRHRFNMSGKRNRETQCWIPGIEKQVQTMNQNINTTTMPCLACDSDNYKEKQHLPQIVQSKTYLKSERECNHKNMDVKRQFITNYQQRFTSGSRKSLIYDCNESPTSKMNFKGSHQQLLDLVLDHENSFLLKILDVSEPIIKKTESPLKQRKKYFQENNLKQFLRTQKLSSRLIASQAKVLGAQDETQNCKGSKDLELEKHENEIMQGLNSGLLKKEELSLVNNTTRAQNKNPYIALSNAGNKSLPKSEEKSSETVRSQPDLDKVELLEDNAGQKLFDTYIDENKIEKRSKRDTRPIIFKESTENEETLETPQLSHHGSLCQVVQKLLAEENKKEGKRKVLIDTYKEEYHRRIHKQSALEIRDTESSNSLTT